MLKAATLPVSMPGSPFGRRDSGRSPKVLMSTSILLSGRQRAEMVTGERLETNPVKKPAPLLSGDRGFFSTLTPSPPRGTRAAQPCPEFKLGVSP